MQVLEYMCLATPLLLILQGPRITAWPSYSFLLLHHNDLPQHSLDYLVEHETQTLGE